MPDKSDRNTQVEMLVDAVSELFPELCGSPVDLEQQAPSIVQRVLNDGPPELIERVVVYYGEQRMAELARSRANQLTNPAFREFESRFHLPPRAPAIWRSQALWRE